MSGVDLRLAVLSDIHGNLDALHAVVADFRQRRVDAALNLGDSLSGPLLPRETAHYLMAQDWTHLAGNHERQLLHHAPRGLSDAYARAQLGAAELAWVASLMHCMPYADGELLLCHGTPDHDNQHLLETVTPHGLRLASAAEIEARLGATHAPVVLCGHSHVPRGAHRGRHIDRQSRQRRVAGVSGRSSVSARRGKRLARCALRTARAARRPLAGSAGCGAVRRRADGRTGRCAWPARVAARVADRLCELMTCGQNSWVMHCHCGAGPYALT
jgi:predicted phosphodiesterase